MAARVNPVMPRSVAEYDKFLEDNKGYLIAVSFVASWSEHCKTTQDLSREMVNDDTMKHVLFVELNAEDVPEISMRYEIQSVPAVVFIRNKAVVEKLCGTDTRNYVVRVAQLGGDGSANVPAKILDRANPPAGSALEERLKRLVTQADVMVFMKGNPEQPRCGFSRQVIELLRETGVEFGTFDILEDEDVRQGLKTFSNWQTYPQIYFKGELIGGLDVIRELKELGTLEGTLKGTVDQS